MTIQMKAIEQYFHVFLTILPSEIQDFLLSFELSTLGSECVKNYCFFLWYDIYSFRLFSLLRTTGLYTKTLAKIIYRDITRFSVVFLIVFIGFCGAMFMALKATGSQALFT